MEFQSPIPFVLAQGIELVSAADGQSELRMSLRADQENHLGMAHGGVLMTLLDVAMAQAVRSSFDNAPVITIEMKTTFFQAATGVLTARGQLLHQTRKMGFAEATVFDAEGRRCAHGTGTFRHVNRASPRPALSEPPPAGETP
jgi:uncharacterized protein (TIGR00369 family)